MDFLILALATFRISSLIADEEGPFGLLEWLRSLVGGKRDEGGKTYGTNAFSKGVTCLWCNSPWIGGALTLAYLGANEMTLWACFPFALSAVVMGLDRWVNG